MYNVYAVCFAHTLQVIYYMMHNLYVLYDVKSAMRLVHTTQVTVLALLSLWFRQLREAEVNKIDGALTLPEKHHLLEALQRLPISFGMAMRVR
jgi:hypothetical protein